MPSTQSCHFRPTKKTYQMPDYSILELQQLSFGQAWFAIQWWASVSFGLMALTRFSGKHLNLIIVIALSAI